MAQGQATVKAVLSGDTVVLIGSATNGPPPELSLTLSSLQAPRLARNPDQSNEPFAWKSREFLRKLVVGKSVMFKVEYRVPSINRDFGSIWLDGQNVCVRVAAEGWAKVKTLEQSRDGHCQDLEEMLRVEQQAVEVKKGIYGTESGESSLSVKWSGYDAQDLLETNKGKVLPAVIESFRDGASMRVILTDSLYMINMNLSGVQCPRLNTPAKGSINDTTPQPDQFALEAKFFSEVRLLQKDIHVLLEGLDTYGNFYGTIVHKAGNIAVELLKNGLAKMSDWSATYVAVETRSIMRNAERIAKAQHLRLWKEWKPATIQGEREYTGEIIEVCSGDTVFVFVPGVGERRVSLSSLRAPRLGNARRGEADAPYAWEAKEFLRTKSIGRRAKVSVEYERDPASTAVGAAAQKRSFATIDVFNSKGQSENVAVAIVREGLAEVIRHRQNDERSTFYDDLLGAETDAKSSRKGIHSGKASGIHRYTDLTADSTKAKQYLPFLRREKVVRGVVQFVSSGTRVKLFIPKENCLINFVISGIKCPNPERKQAAKSGTGKALPIKAAEPFGDEARTFTRKNLMQRNVEIEVEDMDRGGAAFGTLYMTGGARQNFGCILLQEGLGMVDEYSVERMRFCAQLKEAQTKAIMDKKNIWKNYSKPVASVEKTLAELESAPVSISEIVNGGHFFVQKTSTNSLSSLEDKMKVLTEQYGTSGATFEPKRGALCAALFTDSSGTLWYRAKVENRDMDGKIAVRFIDYGNNAVVPMSKLRPLDPSLSQLPGQAIESVFRFIKVPLADEEYGHEAGVSLGEMGWSCPLTAKIHGRDELNRLQVSLYDGTTSLGEELVRAGLARIDRKAKVLPHERTIYDQLVKAQDEARKNRANMWQYGDIGSDDEDHLGPWGR